MQLEAGKKYVDRRGRVFGPLVNVRCDIFGESEDSRMWCGRGNVQTGAEADIDLIAEYVDPDEWVDLPPDHVLRRDIDQVQYLDGIWVPVNGLSGNKACFLKSRCRHKDLPPVKTHDTVELKLCVSGLTPNNSHVYSFGGECPECFLPVRIEDGKFLVDVPVKDAVK